MGGAGFGGRGGGWVQRAEGLGFLVEPEGVWGFFKEQKVFIGRMEINNFDAYFPQPCPGRILTGWLHLLVVFAFSGAPFLFAIKNLAFKSFFPNPTCSTKHQDGPWVNVDNAHVPDLAFSFCSTSHKFFLSGAMQEWG